MNKFPFTARGVADFQAALYLLDNPVVMKEAVAVATDFISWTALHFELEVYVLEELRSLPEAMRLQLGWSIALSLSGRRQLVLEEHLVATEESLKKCSLIFNFSCTVAYDSPDKEKHEGHFRIILRTT
jgi:hypothetical protein